MRLSDPALLERLTEAARLAGWTLLPLSTRKPFRLTLTDGTTTLSAICYIWNLTHGGYPRNPREFRIQFTNRGTFTREAGSKTLLLGWHESLRVFAGFDVRSHGTKGSSPSCQIHLDTLELAAANGFSSKLRGNGELAVAFRPELLPAYLDQLEVFHNRETTAAEAHLLENIAATPLDRPIVDIPASPRATVLRLTQHKIRNGKFRGSVLAAYGYRCAVSGFQLGLLDAAHLLPVGQPGSTDEIRNGICLSALHHRAFDAGLLGIRRDHGIVLNDKRVATLQRIGWDQGLDEFKASLRNTIHLPQSETHWPCVDFLLAGARLKGWDTRKL